MVIQVVVPFAMAALTVSQLEAQLASALTRKDWTSYDAIGRELRAARNVADWVDGVAHYKVWTINPDGQPGTLLARTGSSEKLDVDVQGDWGDDVEALAMLVFSWASLEAPGVRVSALLVKNFDSGTWWTARLIDGEVQVAEKPL